MGQVVRSSDAADEPVGQTLAIGLIQAGRTDNARSLSLEFRERHGANACADVRLDDAARIVGRLQRADIDRHAHPGVGEERSVHHSTVGRTRCAATSVPMHGAVGTATAPGNARGSSDPSVHSARKSTPAHELHRLGKLLG
jgi:hypothetical protein